MSRATDIHVSFTRKLPREQKDGYLHGFSEITLSMSATLFEGEDGSQAIAAMADGLKAEISRQLGIGEAKKADKPAKATKPAKKADKPAKAAKPAEESLPDNISNNPEDRRNPADDIPEDPSPAPSAEPQAQQTGAATSAAPARTGDEIPDDEPIGKADSPAPAWDHGDLQGYLTKLVAGRQISAPRVKEILAGFGASRVNDLSPEGIMEVKAMLAAAAGGGK